MEEAVEALANVITSLHVGLATQSPTEAEEVYLTGFYEQLRRAVTTKGAKLAKSKPGLVEKVLDLLREKACRSRPTPPRRGAHDGLSGGGPVELVEDTLLRLLVQPCTLVGLSARGGVAAAVCAVASAVQTNAAIPPQEFGEVCRILANGAPALELRQLSVLALRDAVLDPALSAAAREAGLETLLALNRRLSHLIPPELRLRHSKDELVAAAAAAAAGSGVEGALPLAGSLLLALNWATRASKRSRPTWAASVLSPCHSNRRP
eukprot:m.316877 g.316877  ORF g.316877 m.316877 type:complete len:264 (+) comp27550_c4_seq1:292-1083(+)